MTELDTGPPVVTSQQQPLLRRSTEDRILAGVCGGLGTYFGTDPVWFRLGFVLLAFAGGTGILFYLIAWLLIPSAQPGDLTGPHDGATGSRGALIAGVILMSIGVMTLVNNFVPWLDRVTGPMAVMAVGAGLLYLGVRREHG